MGGDGESAIGAHLEHAHFVFQQFRTIVGRALWKNDHGELVLDAPQDFLPGFLSALWTASLDPDGAQGRSAPADDGPIPHLCLGHKNQGVGRWNHDGIDVGPVVGNNDRGVGGQCAFYVHPDPRAAVDVAAVPRVGLVEVRMCRTDYFAH